MLLILNILFLLIMILISVAFLTLLERKILSYVQLRKGPNKLGFIGLLQPFSDALKLISKELFYLDYNMKFFILMPLLMFLTSLMLWILYPWFNFISLNYSLIIMMLILGFNIYPLMLIGWISSNNYAMLGSLRSIAQMISFEVSMFLMILIIMMMIENYSLKYLLKFQLYIKFFFLLYPLYFMFILSMLIELNRTPFDLVEGESELVSGFNVEYFSSMFTLIFLSEYSSILFMSMILTMIFFGLKFWSIFFLLIYQFHILLLLWVRSVLPRIRYDELMNMCWNEILMITLMYTHYVYMIKELINLLI